MSNEPLTLEIQLSQLLGVSVFRSGDSLWVDSENGPIPWLSHRRDFGGDASDKQGDSSLPTIQEGQAI